MTPPRFVELIRVSTESQKKDLTHEAQRAELDRLRLSRPGILVERIEALGVSGAKGVADRQDLQRLMQLARAKAFTELRFFSFDRLTRSADMREQAAIFMAVKEAGAVFVDVNQQVIDPASGLGQLYFTMLTTFAAQERTKITERTVAGKKRKAAQGHMVHGIPPYGRRFNKETQSWELVPSEVEIYHRIIDACLSGKTLLDIVKVLNAEAVPSVRGRWGQTSVRRLLTKATIVGEYTAFGYKMQIPPITGVREWELIKATLAQRVTRRKDTKPVDALLRGHGFCAACGMPLWVLTSGANKGQPRYGCPKPCKRDVPCTDRRTIAVADADAFVRDALLNMVRHPQVFEKALAEAAPVEDPVKALRAVEKELTKLAAREARTLRLCNEGFLSEEAAKIDLAAVQLVRKAAFDRKTKLRQAVPAAPLAELQLLRAELAEAVKHATPQRLKELIAILNPVVTLGAAGIEIVGDLRVGDENRPHSKTVFVPEAIPYRLRVQLAA